MRKFLSLMTMCLLAVGALHAETFVMSEQSGFPSTNGDFTLTFGTYTMDFKGNTGASKPTYNANGKDVRTYAKNTIQLTTTGDAMTQVVFNISDAGKRRQAEVTPSEGSVSVNTVDWTVTWTGSSKDVTFTVGDKATYGTDGDTKAGQFDFLSVDINTGAVVETVSNPTISPLTGTFYNPIEVSIKCGTSGASIYYTTDGSTPTATSTLYSAPFTASTNMTVKAIAIKGDKQSEVVEAVYTFATATDVANIAAYQRVDDGTVVRFTNPVNVLAQYTMSSNNVRLFVQDATGNMFIYGKAGQKYNNGDVIPAGFTGTKTTYHGEPELSVNENSNFQAASSNSPIAAETIQAIDVEADLFAHYVYIAGATLGYTTNSSGSKNLSSIADNSGQAVANNSMGITASSIDYDATYNVTAVIGSFKTDTTDVVYEVWPVKLEKVGGGTVTNGVATIAEYQALADDATFTFTGNAVVTYVDSNDLRYVYIKDNTGSAVIYGTNAANGLKQGDVLSPEWTGKKKLYNGLYEIVDFGNLSASGQTQTVTPVEKTTADITTANQNIYCVLRGVKIASVNGRNFTFEDGAAGYNTFNGTVTLPSDLTQTYDIEGVISVYNKAQFAPTRFLTEVVVPDVEDIEALYAMNEGITATIQCDINAIYQSGYNLYVKDANGTYGLVYGHLNEQFENGDIIRGAQASWSNYQGIKELIPTASTFAKAATGNPVQPEVYAIEDLGTDMVHYYVKIENAAVVNDSTKYITINDGTGSMTGFNKLNVEFPADGTYDVTCFVSLHNDVVQLYPVAFGGDEPAVRGDLSGDGVVDVDDLNLVINMMLGKAEKTEAADINKDGAVDVDDMNIIINIMLGKD
ncbi:MAG: chitobiase/beta-hexosaminidase C-terminal domain-containing protein [Muribaculaceae bacterium]|nr:chitobiase/beta-hexosaminidase C-terminal domain-containing protein [Muribaculaceae bacterium]